MTSPRLSKSKYMAGLQCPKRLWLEIHRPGLAPPVSPGQQKIFDQGTRVGELARERFPGGVLIEADHQHLSEGARETAAALEAGATVIFEAVISHDRVLVRPDVLRRIDPASGRWELIEVKSSTSVKEEHLPDIAVQAWVLAGAGLEVERACLMHIDRACAYPDLSNLFAIEDVTEPVGEIVPGVEKRLDEFRAMLARPEPPDVPIGRHCDSPYGCVFREHCWAWVPEWSIFQVPGLRWPVKDAAIAAHCAGIDDLPDDFSPTAVQSRFLESYLMRRPIADGDAIRREFARLTHPLHYLDFETDNPAVPRFEGTHPYEQVPFQYSCHIVAADGTVTHREYLHETMSDPRRPLAESLIAAVGPEGHVIAWNVGFERMVLNALARWLPDLADEIGSIADRLWDLLPVVRRHYMDYRFRGSNGLKSVLPVLVPSMTYEGMAVGEGGEAQIAWNEMIRMGEEPQGEGGGVHGEAAAEADSRGKGAPVREGDSVGPSRGDVGGALHADGRPGDPGSRERLAADLRAYCAQDTWAMVEIMRVLGGG